jgi:hypothetical protein
MLNTDRNIRKSVALVGRVSPHGPTAPSQLGPSLLGRILKLLYGLDAGNGTIGAITGVDRTAERPPSNEKALQAAAIHCSRVAVRAALYVADRGPLLWENANGLRPLSLLLPALQLVGKLRPLAST